KFAGGHGRCAREESCNTGEQHETRVRRRARYSHNQTEVGQEAIVCAEYCSPKAAAVCATMPSFKFDDRLRFIAALVLHCSERAHVPAFFGRHAGSFYLTAIHVLISGFKATNNRQYVLCPETPRQPSQNKYPPARGIRRYRFAVTLKQPRPSIRVA